MLAPKKLKHRKHHRPQTKGQATTSNTIAFGSFGLKAITGGWIEARQIEAARRVMTRYTKRGGKIWIRIFPHRPITSKGTQVTMGGGKGVPEHYIAVVRPGMIMFEMDGITEQQAKEAMGLAAYKLPVKAKFIAKK
ncbi:MAG TPA: 50S ribosomal protein L16 [bacterium]|nr:50S ribosomal protein L16 [bacterium]HNS34288.1 50S ribosomal protein L16 [bacterium]HNZ73046.1 50S ribosomal protein L16 [bacterium]HOH67142.1 50S ribosomal protein L16 [bacterium]HQA64145.1 50S ribosomal protein L16 [bacterium]